MEAKKQMHFNLLNLEKKIQDFRQEDAVKKYKRKEE
jgi:hypothetical protein